MNKLHNVFMLFFRKLQTLFSFCLPKPGTFVSVYCNLVLVRARSYQGLVLFNSCSEHDLNYKSDTHNVFIARCTTGEGITEECGLMKTDEIYFVVSNDENILGIHTSHLRVMSREGNIIIVPDYSMFFIKENC
jgi:hypothetical protein